MNEVINILLDETLKLIEHKFNGKITYEMIIEKLEKNNFKGIKFVKKMNIDKFGYYNQSGKYIALNKKLFDNIMNFYKSMDKNNALEEVKLSLIQDKLINTLMHELIHAITVDNIMQTDGDNEYGIGIAEGLATTVEYYDDPTDIDISKHRKKIKMNIDDNAYLYPQTIFGQMSFLYNNINGNNSSLIEIAIKKPENIYKEIHNIYEYIFNNVDEIPNDEIEDLTNITSFAIVSLIDKTVDGNKEERKNSFNIATKLNSLIYKLAKNYNITYEKAKNSDILNYLYEINDDDSNNIINEINNILFSYFDKEKRL